MPRVHEADHDRILGITVGAVVIPQGMAYAKLAQLPVEFGLYSSLVTDTYVLWPRIHSSTFLTHFYSITGGSDSLTVVFGWSVVIK